MAALQHLSSSIITPQFCSPRSHKFPCRRFVPSASAARQSPNQPIDNAINRRQLIATAAAAAISLSPVGNNKAVAAEEPLSEWERVYLPIDPGVVLLDIAFVPDDPSHGFLLGTRQTILETKDGGNTWAQRSIPSAEDEDFNYRFNSISFKGNEGWIIGKPAILLYTADAGNTWKRIPLSSQLPGDMVTTIYVLVSFTLITFSLFELFMLFSGLLCIALVGLLSFLRRTLSLRLELDPQRTDLIVY